VGEVVAVGVFLPQAERIKTEIRIRPRYFFIG